MIVKSLTTTDRTPGIVPPWLSTPADVDTNPGIVPPWLTGGDIPRILPVDSPNAAVQTTFVPESVSFSPPSLIEALRGL